VPLQQLSRLFEIVADAMDIDGDGFIEQAEYAQLFHLANVGDEVVLAAFQCLDQDGTQEFQAGAAHAFLSQDSANPGTAMLGLA
jgi:flavodoxin